MTQTPAEMLYHGIQLTRPLLRNITKRVEADLEGTGITVGQRAIMEVLLLTGPATAPDLTRILELKRQFIGRELKDMAAKGMVTTTPNPNRKGAHIYELTAESERTIKALRDQGLKEIAVFAERYSLEEIEAFLRIQKAINDEFA
jgi:DNA-binding MarR family transcriptional regulator